METKTISLLGDGGWGTALACLLAGNGHRATLWGFFPEITAETRRLRENRKFLPGIRIPETVQLTNDLSEAVLDADLVVFSTPVLHLRPVAELAAPVLKQSPPRRVMTVAKGIERDTLLRGSEVLQHVLGIADVGLLLGPSHAEEVARRLPCSVVAAAREEAFAREIQRVFMNDRFRVYTSTDTTGVEVGAAVKNVIAIAAGLCDGLGFGDNAKAALLTRGLAEITRLGLAMGARRETFFGLSGLGDLITTCVSPYGRNLKVGQEIGKGRKLEEVLAEIAPMVPEGVWTTRAVCALAERHGVEMPIAQAVRSVLFENKPPLLAAQSLMTREPKAE
jgi:glycerol-3-phosphate dehydrogenase (NAD(P)+)